MTAWALPVRLAGIPATVLPAAALIAVGAVPEELLAAAAATAVPLAESILAASGLANGKFRRRARRRRLTAHTRERRANQRTMHRAFFFSPGFVP